MIIGRWSLAIVNVSNGHLEESADQIAVPVRVYAIEWNGMERKQYEADRVVADRMVIVWNNIELNAEVSFHFQR